MKQSSELQAWQSLKQQVEKIRINSEYTTHKLFPTNVYSDLISLDYSDQTLNSTAWNLLLELAQEVQLKSKINGLMNGAIVNLSKNCPALHTALRLPDQANPIIVNDHNIIPEIIKVRDQAYEIAEKIRNLQWYGYSGKPIINIVNIGVGGSDLGPKFCLHALQDLISQDLNFYFISDCDPLSFKDVVKDLSPETTLFIIASKSFTTSETLYNFKQVYDWLGPKQNLTQHLIAVTANYAKAQAYGLKYILPIWSWVGGRYSATSAINLITTIAIGYQNFQALLQGAHNIDLHFLNNDYANNLPIIFALLGIWNSNFLNLHNLIMLVYSRRLYHFVPFVQQLDMESNGKSIDLNGMAVNYATGPMVWGGLGNPAQHSYYQLMCQGTHKFSVDFLTIDTYKNDLIYQNFLAQRKTLTHGIQDPDNNYYIAGNIPCNHINLKDHSPESIGALIALYEHKIFAQSVIWNINPFDQPGVESAKRFLLAEKQKIITTE